MAPGGREDLPAKRRARINNRVGRDMVGGGRTGQGGSVSRVSGQTQSFVVGVRETMTPTLKVGKERDSPRIIQSKERACSRISRTLAQNIREWCCSPHMVFESI